MKKSYDQIFEELKQQYTLEEIAEAFVFPGPTDGPEREAIRSQFGEFRRKIRAADTPEDKLISRMLQLRFQVQSYLRKRCRR